MAQESDIDMNSADKDLVESNPANDDVQAKATSKEAKSHTKTKKSKNIIECTVSTLEGTEVGLEIEVDKNADGEVLFSKVSDRLNVLEKDYFGLKFIDSFTNMECWLDLHKGIKKQLKRSAPIFQFAVKFYEPEPARLLDEYTRYLLYLQLREDVVEGRLPCSQKTYALLGSYTAQAEFGDYDAVEHRDDYLDEYQFAPEEDEEMIYRIQDLHRDQRGQFPAQAELNYLEIAKVLPSYGMSVYTAKDEKKQEVQVGISYIGIAVYREEELDYSFSWPTVLVIAFKKKRFTVRLKAPEDKKQKIKRNHTFKLNNAKKAKQLYKSAVEYHTFYRLSRPDPPRKKRELGFGSKFRYSDRTLYELRRQPSVTERLGGQFIRSPSKRRTGSSRSKRTIDRRVLSPVASPEIEEDTPQKQEPVTCFESELQFEEIEIEESQPDDYKEDEWEIIEKVLPNGAVKRYRRRIITTTHTTTTTYVIRGGTQEDEILLESKAISPVVPIDDESTKELEDHQEEPEEERDEPKPEITTTTIITEEIIQTEVKAEPEDKLESEAIILGLLSELASSKKPSATVKPLPRDDLNYTSPSPPPKTSTPDIKILVYNIDSEETSKILSHEESEAERIRTNEEALNLKNAAEIEELRYQRSHSPVIEEVTLGIDGDDSIGSIKIAHVVCGINPPETDYDDEDEVILEKANLSRISTTSEADDDLTAEDTRQVKTLDRKFFKRAPPEKSYHRHSHGDELDDYSRETRTMPRKGAKKTVSLITRDELIRCYSQGGIAQDSVFITKEEEEPQINYSLKDELGLNADQGERGFVKNQIGQHEKIHQEESIWKKEQTERRSKSSLSDHEHSRSSLYDEHPIKGAVPTRATSFSEPERTGFILTREPPAIKVRPVVFHPDTSGESAVFEEANEGGLDSNAPDAIDGREIGTYNVPHVQTKTIVFDESAPLISEPSNEESEPGIVQTKTVAISVPHQVRTVETQHTFITRTLPPEVITQTVIIDGDTSNMDPDELKKVMEISRSDGSSVVAESSMVTTSTTMKTIKTTHVQHTIVTGETVNVTGGGEADEEMQKTTHVQHTIVTGETVNVTGGEEADEELQKAIQDALHRAGIDQSNVLQIEGNDKTE